MAGQTETIIRAIVDEIERGDLGPGDLVEEQRLIDTYDVSRTPLREALLTLEASGLIVRLPRKGAVVFKPTLEEFLAILEVHASLEGQAAGLAARRLSADHGRELEAAVVACETHDKEHGDDRPDDYYRLNMRFHEVVARSAGNPFLLDLVKTNARKLMAYYRARYRYAGAISASARDHRAIAMLILDRNSAEAELAMAKHVQFDQITAMDLLAALG